MQEQQQNALVVSSSRWRWLLNQNMELEKSNPSRSDAQWDFVSQQYKNKRETPYKKQKCTSGSYLACEFLHIR